MIRRFVVLLLWPVLAQAQGPEAIAPGVADPALEASTLMDREGTTIVGDRESPIGLFIQPWKNALPEKELDRPARYLEEVLLPLDAEVFRRQVEYFNTINDHLRAKAAPAAPLPAAR